MDVSKHSVTSNVPPNSSPLRQESSCASPGNPSGSTLRKNRKKKIPPNTEPVIDLPEFDSTGKRLCTKKEHFTRLFECIRYRTLKKGDVVAARVSSRNLWILARVLQSYPTSNLPLLDFVRLPESKREQLFKDKVLIKDVEDKQDDTDSAIKVARSLILPLPRSVSEAADWGQRYKKGSRVYALYPNTTALYTATILDATTYARDDDDIIVVRFDGDEPDASGTIPSCHIPSRFVTLIPKGFPGEQASSEEHHVGSSLFGNSKKKKSDQHETTSILVPPPSDYDLQFVDLNFDDPLTGFDDLDFDLLGDS
jgi:SGF29 tudor-like domain